MAIVRLDAHAHLYDSYELPSWSSAAVKNLRGGDLHVAPVVIVVDRAGQDSFARFRREPSGWREVCEGRVGIYQTADSDLTVIRGAQYVAQERIEVLGLGCFRSDLEGRCAGEIVSAIRDAEGIPCLPWSPGKWLGARGAEVRKLLDRYTPQELSVGDVAIRSSLGPPSSLLARARALGYRVFHGTDPLPFNGEESLVGSFGQEIEIDGNYSTDLLAKNVLERLRDPGCRFVTCGQRNGAIQAFRRFVVSNLSRPAIASAG
jgi:hypothetical protein